jgi:hypothetical protein
VDESESALRSRVLAGSFLTTLRVATQHWIDHQPGSLLGTVRAALEIAAPRQAAPNGSEPGASRP